MQLVLVFTLLSSATALSAAPPSATNLFPAGAQRGSTVTVTVAGSFSTWPVEAWCNQEHVAVKALEKKGQFAVVVGEEAASGLAWLRFHDNEGASSPRPFMIDSLPELNEDEPNDDPLAPQAIAAKSIVNGRFAKRGDVDTFAVNLEAGQSLVAALQANWQLGSPIDAVLQVCDARGFVVAQNHDDRGLDPLIVFEAPTSGTYLVRSFAFPSQPNSTIGFSGGDDYIYRLTVTTGGFVRHALPLAVPRGGSTDVQLVGWNFDPLTSKVEHRDNSLMALGFDPSIAGSMPLGIAEHRIELGKETLGNGPQQIELPVDLSACLTQPGRSHAFRFTASKGDKLDFELQSRSFGFPLDGVLRLIDLASGEQLARVDDSNKQPDPTLSYTLKADGEYELRVSDLHDRGGVQYAYRLIARHAKPGYKLSVGEHAFRVKAGESAEIALKISRDKGYEDGITIEAVDLPPGVTAEKITSTGKGDSVKLKLTTRVDAKSGPIRIRATTDENAPQRFAIHSLDSLSLDIDQLWLTVGQ